MTTVLDRIEGLLSSGQEDEARRLVDNASPDEMNSQERMFCGGRLAEHQHRWADAASAYESVLAEHPGDCDAAFRMAYICDLLGDDDKAIELYEQCTDESPAHVNALINLAVLYEDREQYDDALNCVEHVLDEHPNHKRARLFKKDILSALDMYYDEEHERHREKRDALLEMPISEFELSVRSRNCLKQMNMNYLGDLLRTTAAELLAYKNFGETSLHEIESMLSLKGLRLGQLLEEKDGDLGVAALDSDPAKANILNRSVAELELSVRSRKCLMRLGINLIGELVSRSEAELLGIKNFGITSLSEIKRRLTEFGLALKNG